MNANRIGKWVAGFGCATILLTSTGCHTTRYERTTGEFMDDQMLTRRVKHALDAQPVYKYPDVRVQTFRGVVQLGGFVASEQQRQAAAEIVQKVRGVAEIENAISLAPLAQDNLRDYIPGRDANDTNRHAVGSPARQSRSQTGTNTWQGTTTNSPASTTVH